MNKNNIMSALFVGALITCAVSVMVIASSVECVPVTPIITALVSAAYALAFYGANNW